MNTHVHHFAPAPARRAPENIGFIEMTLSVCARAYLAFAMFAVMAIVVVSPVAGLLYAADVAVRAIFINH